MAIVSGAPAHRWVPSVLLLAVAACGAGSYGGMQKQAVEPSTNSGGGGGYTYGPSPAPGVAMDTGHAAVEPIARAEPAPERPGLGTSWGEAVSAPISFSPFVRSSTAPWAEVLLHYNDAQGVAAHAAYLGTVPQPLEVFAGDGSLSVALTDESGRILSGYHANGRALIVGNDGQRYRIVVRNGTTARFEVVASVDGLDVIDGNPADPNRRGYIVDPHGVLVVDGFRTSDSAVAAFRFGKVADSYAAKSSGDRNVGIVGLAIFSERGAVWSPAELQRRDTADPFPQRGYAVPPR